MSHDARCTSAPLGQRLPTPATQEQVEAISRRALLAGAAGALGSAVLAGAPKALTGQETASAGAPSTGARPVAANDATRVIGLPTRAVGERSPFVQPRRTPAGLTTGESYTPLQDLTGTITPADLHYERHHAGVPLIDPAHHELLIHGLVDRPMVFTLADLQRFPSVTRTHFLECSGNGRTAYRTPKPGMTPQLIDGLTSNTEWTGVPLATLFNEVAVRPEARWFLAEGSDACRLDRSVPLEKAYADALVAYAQNGEPLRPENGFPMRLLLPGWEGNINVKWLRRIKLGPTPWMTRWETARYTDPLPNDTARMFSFEMDAKSLITSPAYPQMLGGPGWWPVTGLAWSGRGRITRVDVSTDGGHTWAAAELQDPVLPKAHTRFRHEWRWDGREAVLMSRAVDETGYVQPGRAALLAVRGPGTDYHMNSIRAWRVLPGGEVVFQSET